MTERRASGMPADDAPGAGRLLPRLHAVWTRRKWVVILAFLAPAAAGVTAIWTLPNVYRSTALVLVERQQVPEAFVRPTVTSELETRLHTISQEILSRSRLESLIARLGLYPELRGIAPMEELVERLRVDVSLELKSAEGQRRTQTTAFALSYRGRDPQTVAVVANTLASFYVEENLRVREQQAASTAQFLKTQLQQARARLDEQESRVSAFRTQHVGELPQQMGANMAQIETLNSQLRLNADQQVRAAERVQTIRLQMSEANLLGAATAAAGAASAGPEAPASRLVRLRQELATAQARYFEGHPSVQRLRSEIALVQQLIAPTPSDTAEESLLPASPYTLRLRESLQTAEAEARILRSEESRLKQTIAMLQRRVENTPRREQEFQDLARDHDSTKEHYQSLLKRHEEAQLAENMEQRQKGEQFRVLDPALPSPTPAAPKRARLLVACLAMSVFSGAGALILLERMDTSFHSVRELRAFTSVPILVTISAIDTAADLDRMRRRFHLTAAGATAGLALVVVVTYLLTRGNETLVGLLARGT